MSNGSFGHRNIDEAIDRAVRELVALDPRPGLRARVLAGIGHRALGPWVRRSPGAWALGSAAAAAIVILAVMFWKPASPPPQIASAPAPSPIALTRSPTAPTPSPTAPAPVAPAPARMPTASAIFGPDRARVSATGVAGGAMPETSLVPFVADDHPPAVAPIALTPLPPLSEIRITAIEIPRITIPALSPPR